jgi:hypothetical protein
MCALVRELVIPVSDLHRLAVECGTCHTVVTVDLGSAPAIIAFCSVCRHDYSPDIKQRLSALREILDALATTKECAFSFRVAPPLDHPRD